MTPSPSPAALERMRALGEAKLVAFLGEISSSAMLAAAHSLPPAPGFRKLSDAGLRQRKRALAQAFLSRRGSSTTRANADRAFYGFWRLWALERLSDDEEIASLFDAIEAAAALTGEDHVAEYGKAAVALFSALETRSLQNGCSREFIERLLLFSPFDETPEIQKLVSSAKSAADVERDAAVAELPQRLRQDEQELRSLEGRVAAVADRVELAVDSAARAIGDTKALHVAIAGLSTELQDLKQMLASDRAGGKGALTAQAEQMESLAQNTDKRLAAANAATDKLTQALVRLGEEFSSSWLDLDSRMADLARAVKEPAASHALGASRVGLEVRPLGGQKGTAPVPLESYETACTYLASALERAGLKRSGARVLAEEVCAAIAVGQVVFFRGALATSTARICTMALGGEHAVRVSVPASLTDGELLRAALQGFDADPDLVHAVAIEGINHSSIDLMAEVLRDLVMRDAGRATFEGSWFVFASIARGPATLDPDPRYLELGPIFDTDYLDWRLRPATEAPIVGHLRSETLHARTAALRERSADTEEAMRLLRRFLIARNPQVEITVVGAYAALTARTSSQSPSALQSLAFGWLVPLALATHTALTDIDAELDGGKCDVAAADPRIASMLGELLRKPS